MDKEEKWLERHSVDGRPLYLVPVTSQDLRTLLEPAVTSIVEEEKIRGQRFIPAGLRNHADVWDKATGVL